MGNSASGGRFSFTHIVVKQPYSRLLYHELGHYYFTGAYFPKWLNEGGAEFVGHYAVEAPSISEVYSQARNGIAECCAPHGAANVQGWIETMPEGEKCEYVIGLHFLAGMYRTMGHDVVLSALRELYEREKGTGDRATKDWVYQAFLTNTPSSQRDEFRDLYHCLHGRPISGYTATPKAAPSRKVRDALAALYNATNGPGWTNSGNWLTDAPLDQWHGVVTECDGTVTHLALKDNQLTGPIPPELGNLSNITWLNLSGNQLTGEIPPELGDLSALETLILSENQLTGPIPPELGDLSALESLTLSENQLIGPIPPELGDLSNLHWLTLSENQLIGPIPPELGDLSNLHWLTLSENQLIGPIPPELGGLSELAGLLLFGNQLTGPIPPELGDLSGLQRLSLSDNELTGCVPQGLASVEFTDIYDLGLEVCEDS